MLRLTIISIAGRALGKKCPGRDAQGLVKYWPHICTYPRQTHGSVFSSAFPCPQSQALALHTAFGGLSRKRRRESSCSSNNKSSLLVAQDLERSADNIYKARIQCFEHRYQLPNMPDFPVNPEAFPASTRTAAGDVDGVHTNVMVLRFADKIMVTISQGGRLAHWVRKAPVWPVRPRSAHTATY